MKQYELVKYDIAECSSAMEMVGYLDGLCAAATEYCRANCPEEVYEMDDGGLGASIYGVAMFLDHDVEIKGS